MPSCQSQNLSIPMSQAYVAPTPRTLDELLQSKFDARTAIILPASSGSRRRISYAALRSLIHSVSRSLLAGGLQPGQRIALSLPNSLDLVASFLAITNARGVAAPLNPAYTVDEVKYYLRDMQCAAILLPKGGAPLARKAAVELGVMVYDLSWRGEHLSMLPAPAQAPSVRVPDAGAIDRASMSASPLPVPSPEDVALILHTSGTTSAPKAVPLNHGNLTRTLTNICNTYRLQPEDTCMLVMPLFHVHGLMACLLSPLASGGSVIVPPKFSAGSFWGEFAAEGATWYSAVPTIHQILLAHESSQPSTALRRKLKFIRSCSSALAAPTHAALESTFGVPVVEAYAMTEASHQMTSNNLPGLGSGASKGLRKAGSVGVGQGVEVAILDPAGKMLKPMEQGEISIRGPNVTRGYLNNPKANAECFTEATDAGAAKGSFGFSGPFFRTGDQGYLDADGFVWITGRLKELINRGGEKIAPLEIDAAMLGHASVAEAISFARPDEMLGQDVAAAIVPKPEVWARIQSAGAPGTEARARAEAELRASVIAHCQSRLSGFKVPRLIYFADALPKTATGKIQRRNIADYFLKLKIQPPIAAKL